MSRHRPFGLAGLHGAMTGEPQLYIHDPSASSARPDSSRTDVWPSSTRRRAFGRFVARALHHLQRSFGSKPAVRNAGPSAPGFAP
jgi:hypothetical protein